tara:strand:+ start:1152 stop:1310 length:159 start_codon:yes stop_codon:yes gene_type:complete
MAIVKYGDVVSSKNTIDGKNLKERLESSDKKDEDKEIDSSTSSNQEQSKDED